MTNKQRRIVNEEEQRKKARNEDNLKITKELKSSELNEWKEERTMFEKGRENRN
jgi:hypothetical protein